MKRVEAWDKECEELYRKLNRRHVMVESIVAITVGIGLFILFLASIGWDIAKTYAVIKVLTK